MYKKFIYEKKNLQTYFILVEIIIYQISTNETNTYLTNYTYLYL